MYNSEKRGKLVLDTKDNFLKCMSEHYQNDDIVTPEK